MRLHLASFAFLASLGCDLHGDINIDKIDLGEGGDTAQDTDPEIPDEWPPGTEVPPPPEDLTSEGEWVSQFCYPDPEVDGSIPTDAWVFAVEDGIAPAALYEAQFHSVLDELWRPRAGEGSHIDPALESVSSWGDSDLCIVYEWVTP
jgi:hypothetical protein